MLLWIGDGEHGDDFLFLDGGGARGGPVLVGGGQFDIGDVVVEEADEDII